MPLMAETEALGNSQRGPKRQTSEAIRGIHKGPSLYPYRPYESAKEALRVFMEALGGSNINHRRQSRRP